MSQLKALLRKNYLIKRSQCCQTSCEIIPPILICFIFVLIFGLLQDLKQTIPAQIYVNQSPTSDMESLIIGASELDFWIEPKVHGPSKGNLNRLFYGMPACFSDKDDPLQFCVFAPRNASDNLQSVQSSLEDANADSAEAAGSSRRRDKDDFEQDDGYNGVVPIPPLDLYMNLHKLYYASKQAKEKEKQEGVNGTNTQEIGDRGDRALSYVTSGKYDNLLRLGALLFAPDNSEVRALVEHLNSTYKVIFDEYFGGIYASEDDAVEAALKELPNPKELDSGEVVRRAWAVISVSEADRDAGRFDYTIRMNFSATPSTKHFFMGLSPKLTTEYQGYYSSGFLSLQHAISTYFLDLHRPPRLNRTSLPAPPFPFDPNNIPQPYDPSFLDYWKNVTDWLNSTRYKRDQHRAQSRFQPLLGETTVAAPFPTPEVELDWFYKLVRPMASILLGLCMFYTLSRLVAGIVDEKEKQLRLLLEMMGLQGYMFGLSWLITGAVTYTVIAFLMTLILKCSFMYHVEGFLLLVFFWNYCMSQLGFGLLIAACSNRAKIASIVGPLMLFAMLLPRYAFFYAVSTEQVSAKLWVSLFSPTAFSFGIDMIFEYGAAQAPLTWELVWADDLPFAAIILMLLADTLLYMALAFAIDFASTSQKVPSIDDISRFAYNLVTSGLDLLPIPSRTRHSSRSDGSEGFQLLALRSDNNLAIDGNSSAHLHDGVSSELKAADTPGGGAAASHSELGTPHKDAMALAPAKEVPGDDRSDALDDEGDEGGDQEDTLLEPVPEGLVPFVEITDLRKVYQRGCGGSLQRTVAVNGLTLTLYRGQITCLLGHNGAGKTTTISMLTGMIVPTSGGSTVGGLSITKDQARIRRNMGVCPQHDILWDNLSVEEHLRLFATLKGVDPSELDALCYSAAEEVSLAGRGYKTLARALSGGMKRKLCVAIAFMGNPSVVYLDEPTSGMDPYSRRYVWNLLRSKKPGRVVVLTTHFMDEAELLADRIAIMAMGKLNCCGSALYLKSRSGIGYTLTTVSAAREGGGASDAKDAVAVCDPRKVVETIQEFVPSATVLNIAAGEVSVRLPLRAVSQFPALFDRLEKTKGSLGVGAYGVTITTLEEVFMQVCRGGKLGEERSVHSTRASDSKGAASASAPKDTVGLVAAVGGGKMDSLLSPSGGGVLDEDKKQGGRGEGEDDEDYHHDQEEEEIGEERRDGAVAVEDEDEQPSGARGAAQRRRGAAAGGAGAGGSSSRDLYESVEQWGKEFSRNAKMLFWKRGLCAIRDLSALFWEFMVPLGIICLVLLVLKLNVNPAGPSILLDADLYRQHNADTARGEQAEPAEVLLSPPSSGPWHQLDTETAAHLIGGSGFLVANTSLPNSLRVSEKLLGEVLDHNRLAARTNAYCPNDTLLINVSEPLHDALLRLSAKLSQTLPMYASPQTRHWDSWAPPPPPDDSGKMYLYETKVGATILHNTTYYHALPIGLAELHQARLRELKGGGAYVRVRNHPLPLTKIASLYIDTFLTLIAAVFLLLPFCYIPGTLAMFWVRERELHVKHVHFVSGVTPLQYWLVALVYDILCVAVIDTCFVIILILYGNDEFIGTPGRSWATYFLVFSYGVSAVSLSLLLSSLFKSATGAQIGISAFHFISGFVLLLFSSILESIPSTYDFAEFMKQAVFRMLPPFVLGEGLINLSVVALFEEVLGETISPWDWKVLGRPLAYMYSSAALYFLLVLALDSKSDMRAFYRYLFGSSASSPPAPAPAGVGGGGPRSFEMATLPQRPGARAVAAAGAAGSEDEDVAEERRLVRAYLREQEAKGAGAEAGAAIAIESLRKVYPPMAVDSLSLLVPRRQCFGLLGVNGAGKSTTLKILTADVHPTSGKAYVNGISVDDGVRAIREQLGYCPQHNALLPKMTVSETLWLYARFRGLSPERAQSRSEELIRQLRLDIHEHKQCGALSGGNKRKVSLAIALVGDPPVLFLDEPSSGMDPVTRRYMWDLIADLGRKRCVVLTTHSMEECEALCQRVGIMSKGRLRCLGTLQRLKTKHGKGYHLEVSCPEAKSQAVQRALARDFKDLSVLESYGGKMKLRLPEAKIPISSIFRAFQGHKKRLGITDYSVSQSSLEQIFISMVRESFDEGGSLTPAARGIRAPGRRSTRPSPDVRRASTVASNEHEYDSKV